MAGGTHLTVGSAGSTEARALYARMAVITGSIASGFRTAASATTTSTTTPTTAVTTSTNVSTRVSTDDSTTADTRLSGVGLHLGAAEQQGATSHHDLFATLRSALDGFDAQTGFDQLLVRQLISA